MKRSVLSVTAYAWLALMIVGLAGCQSYSDTLAKEPPLAGGQGRIYFYRDGSPFGSIIQPHVSLNDVEVGKSVPGGFFYVDRPAGDFIVTCHSEGVQSLYMSLAAGETRYVRTTIIAGMGIGHVIPDMEDETTAMKTLKGCHYTGS